MPKYQITFARSLVASGFAEMEAESEDGARVAAQDALDELDLFPGAIKWNVADWIGDKIETVSLVKETNARAIELRDALRREFGITKPEEAKGE